MKAFILDRYGSKVALRAGEVADPDVREDEVLVQIHAAGVNLCPTAHRSCWVTTSPESWFALARA